MPSVNNTNQPSKKFHRLFFLCTFSRRPFHIVDVCAIWELQLFILTQHILLAANQKDITRFITPERSLRIFHKEMVSVIISLLRHCGSRIPVGIKVSCSTPLSLSKTSCCNWSSRKINPAPTRLYKCSCQAEHTQAQTEAVSVFPLPRNVSKKKALPNASMMTVRKSTHVFHFIITPPLKQRILPLHFLISRHPSSYRCCMSALWYTTRSCVCSFQCKWYRPRTRKVSVPDHLSDSAAPND